MNIATAVKPARGSATIEEPVVELIPAMLTAFLDSDRNFIRARHAGLREKG
ncbi:hypothetical protein BV98_000548 [Sphingobium herbicidovorans NBRC 16415]|uniref:DUF2274 domain-containing protein n=1 Tax=Sphingobium herbicidovorans (strain ATCC 700291 / DSM 11019 / CCUG 56400 / KCTC 2939 / LMG 18315 / NBRC 16415 / MH) TaxID=1219045 RepID=A0A086PE73_SPHHM|nr:DUF2274 domain-containing protein [Sphingobium herbicidovorans]KFG91691.1 hypothetical protein BV98_000548 [Sphingobium herbicidovorans NBRC 16415]